MRLNEALARCSEDELERLEARVVPRDERGGSAFGRVDRVESRLTRSDYVEKNVWSLQPPVLSVLRRVLSSLDLRYEPEPDRSFVLDEVENLCERVSAGDLAHRVVESSQLYIRMLEAALQNDLVLDPSESYLLRTLRAELGLFEVEHFLLQYHRTIQGFWRTEGALEKTVDELVNRGILFPVPGEGFVLPDEHVPSVREVLGQRMSDSGARRLLEKLESGAHLKAALADCGLPTSGSKQARVDRIVEGFVSIERVVETMHILDLRDLLKRHGLSTGGRKDELVERMVDHVATGRDLIVAAKPVEPAREPKELSEAAFHRMMGPMRGHQLQQLLLRLGLRHSGSKSTRIQSLFEGPSSERSILSIPRREELHDFARRHGLDPKGSKVDIIEEILVACRQRSESPPEARADAEAEAPAEALMTVLVPLLERIELSSRSPSRFDPVRDRLASELGLEADEVAVKFVGDRKNARNRIGEALRGHPEVLLLLVEGGHDAEIQPWIRSRIALSPETSFVVLNRLEVTEPWRCRGIHSVVRGALAEALLELLPEAEFAAVEPRGGEGIGDHTRDLAARVREVLEAEASPSEHAISTALRDVFDRPDLRIRTKHVTASKNLYNRILEAIGAGCDVLVLTVPTDLVGGAQAELERQLSQARVPHLAVLLEESDGGGVGSPTVVTGWADARSMA